MLQTVKLKVFRALDSGTANNRSARIVDIVLISLISLTVAMTVLATKQSFFKDHQTFIVWFSIVASIIFLSEYALRLWVSDLYPPLRQLSPWRARLDYALQPIAIIDFLAVLPFLLSLILDEESLKAFVVLRLLRFFKFARYSPALRSLLSAVLVERKAIGASLLVILGTILTAATFMYLTERDAQPDALGSIPAAMWWAFSTLTTVGYGDVIPITPLGKVIASLVMLLGYCLFALPVGIVGTAFVREINSRDFVVSWSMVAEVPLFQKLSPSEVADLCLLLHARTIREGHRMQDLSQVDDRLFFIVSGRVIATINGKECTLGTGDFFGNLPLVESQKPTRIVAEAEGTVQLLVLQLEDLRRFMDRKPKVAKKIIYKARQEFRREKSRNEK
nr:cyclic nucleotide-gated ion channel [Pseudovibrio sp. M1P-2-3]